MGEVVKYNNYSCPLPKFSTVLSKPTLFVLTSKRILFFHMAFVFTMFLYAFNIYLFIANFSSWHGLLSLVINKLLNDET